MNPDESDQLEDRLRRLPLREPSAELDARIASLARPVAVRRGQRRVAGLAVTAAAVAASLLVLVVWHTGHDGGNPRNEPLPITARPKQPPEQPATRHEAPAPVHIEEVWSAVAATEIVDRGDAPPVQRVSRQMVRRVRLIDARHHVRMEWSIPSEQTFDAPLEFN